MLWLGLWAVFLRQMTVLSSTRRFLRNQELLSLKLVPKNKFQKKRVYSTTLLTLKQNHGKCGHLKTGLLPKRLFSLSCLSQRVIQLVLSTLLTRLLIFHLSEVWFVRNTGFNTLFLLVVLVLPRLLSSLCIPTNSMEMYNLSSVSTSQTLLALPTSKLV
jgi:hypothetical protein